MRNERMQGTKTLATAKRLVVVLLVVAGILMGSQAMLTQARGGSSGGSRVAGVVQAAGTLQVGAPRLPYVPVDQALIDVWAGRFEEFDQGRYDG